MPKRDRGPKPTKGRGNTDKSKVKSHIGPSFAGRNSKQTQTHHIGIVYLDSGNSSPGVKQPTKGKKGTIRTHSQPSQPVESGFLGEAIMAYHEDHAEGTG